MDHNHWNGWVRTSSAGRSTSLELSVSITGIHNPVIQFLFFNSILGVLESALNKLSQSADLLNKAIKDLDGDGIEETDEISSVLRMRNRLLAHRLEILISSKRDMDWYRREAKYGFDAAIHSMAGGVYIKYKRAERLSSGELLWKLNRTTKKDQLSLLKNLEATGLSVFYALPLFFELIEVYWGRGRLLMVTAWVKPSSINPIGGPNGHHEIHFDPSSNKWWVASEDPTPIEKVDDLNEVTEAYRKKFTNEQKEKIVNAWSELFSEAEEDSTQGATMYMHM